MVALSTGGLRHSGTFNSIPTTPTRSAGGADERCGGTGTHRDRRTLASLYWVPSAQRSGAVGVKSHQILLAKRS